jgi:hypothetical protein
MLTQRSFSPVLALLLLPAAFGLSACSSDNSSEAPITKQQASQEGTQADGRDLCAEQGWYGDGECDTFCPDADTDCAHDPDEAVVCALFIEVEDGVCSRPDSDPCRMQDPDCGVKDADDDGVVCALYIEESDGECSRPDTDPCRSQDPDCTEDGVACAEYIEDSDGVCSRPETDPCRRQDPDC